MNFYWINPTQFTINRNPIFPISFQWAKIVFGWFWFTNFKLISLPNLIKTFLYSEYGSICEISCLFENLFIKNCKKSKIWTTYLTSTTYTLENWEKNARKKHFHRNLFSVFIALCSQHQNPIKSKIFFEIVLL